MKKIFVILLGLFCFCFLTGMASLNNYSPEITAAYEQLKIDLQQKGVELSQITDSAKSMKDMLMQGVKKDDLKKYVLDLYHKKIDEASLKSSLDSTSKLMKDGESFKEAKSYITKVLQDAKAKGLQGEELNDKIRDAFNQKQDELEQLQKEAYDKGRQMKEDAAKNLNDLQNKSVKDLMSGK